MTRPVPPSHWFYPVEPSKTYVIMKTNAKFFILLITLMCTGFLFPNHSIAKVENLSIESKCLLNTPGSYSWNAVFGAIRYTVDMEHTVTGQQFHYETTTTAISFGFIPQGMYTLVVKARFANGSSYIIIEDLVDM